MSTVLALQPLESDPELVVDDAGRSYWKATTFDPALLAKLPAGEPDLKPGTYKVRVTIALRGGQLEGPQLYIPLSFGGYSETSSVRLALDGKEYVAEFYIPNSVRELRFDPSAYPCEFECEGLQVELVDGARQGAFGSMARTLRTVSPRQLSLWFRQGIRLLFAHGPGALWEAAYWALVNHSRGQASYGSWVAQYSTPSSAQLAAMTREARTFPKQPVISFITPVYNTPAPFLRAMFESVLAQAYPNWELCIADDASTEPHVRPILEEFARRDARIKVTWRAQNGHISAASNSALELATGDFVALLDHDDAIPPDALFWVARELSENPDAALTYSDEDKLDFDGHRTNAYFKCDWNYDLFLSHNLITHLGVYRADIVRRIGGFRVGFEGAQDYDLALRFIEQVEPRQIRHIPRVLYHWRMLAGSTAVGAGEKSYAAERARLAVSQHLERTGVKAVVDTIPEMAVQRVRYALPEPRPLASIIIPTRNGLKLVRTCIESVRAKTTYQPYEIILVDNGSDERASLDYFESLEREGAIRILKDARPFNFSRLNNEAARAARGEYVVLLNNDIEVITPDWLGELVSHAARPGIGAVGARLWYPNETIQHAGLILVAGLAGHAHYRKKRGDHGYFSRASLIQALAGVTAACLCVRRSLYLEVGGLDETLEVAFNDVDFCLRLHAAGHRNIYTPYAELYHHESASRGYEDTPEKIERFRREATVVRERWMPILMNDPHYNPNLSLTGEPFTLAWPPRISQFDASR